MKKALLMIGVCCALFAEATEKTGISYYDDDFPKSGDLEYLKERCKLDLLVPDGTNNFATVVWFHGGGLTGGMPHYPRRINTNATALVKVSYRLSGKRAKCPDYLYDAAAATAWVLKHIGEYGGDTNKVYVSGMSAGGYLSAMVALAPKYLGAYGYKPTDLAGAFPISGQMTTHFRILQERREKNPDTPTIFLDEYAPISNANPNVPPIALFVGDTDYEWAERNEENKLLEARLRRTFNNGKVRLYVLPACSHGTVCAPSLDIINSILNGGIKIW